MQQSQQQQQQQQQRHTNFSKMMRTKHYTSSPVTTRAASAAATATSNDDIDSDVDGETATISTVKHISDILETGLNEYSLQAIIRLLQRGESPDAVVAMITSLSQHSGRR
jgi:hypothetical protein